MQIPASLKPGLTGAALGAVATLIIGFSAGGWYTTGSAEKLATTRSAVAVVDATVGKGKLFLFGPEITFRGQPHGTFDFLFNGIYYGPAAVQAQSAR